jgi:hypothetical protein
MGCITIDENQNLSMHNTPVFLQQSCIHVPTYLTAYADGEGCFCVSLNKSVRTRLGWELRPSFSVSQNKDRAEVLYLFKSYFDCGTLRPDISDNTLKYEVRSLGNLTNVVIPHFDNYPLLSSKRNDFLVFRDICLRMSVKQHFTKSGLEELLALQANLNKSGKKKYAGGGIKI